MLCFGCQCHKVVLYNTVIFIIVHRCFLKGTSSVIVFFIFFCSPINAPIMSVFTLSQCLVYMFFLMVSLPYPSSPPRLFIRHLHLLCSRRNSFCNSFVMPANTIVSQILPVLHFANVMFSLFYCSHISLRIHFMLYF